ncbi:alpha/beta fold hydrolase [Alkalibacillus aidingensis]|uniref:alpha/beta fold hydrolase n=1 Tax=Alkalibacillus aidingensis TaxID=2747607 RepID=UPI0016601789|nr:alpha/beta fold hydrolase [Alkalibacillus aidingensis]
MRDFVIVHGAWDGGWYWKDTAAGLRKLGHDVYTPSLTGLGDRTHLATRETDLDTHVEDIVNVILYEDLQDVLLVGHSYGGWVATGVAEWIPERIGRLIYVDALVPFEDGQAVTDVYDEALIEQIEELADAYGDGWKVPYPVSPASDSRFSAHPLKTFTQPLKLGNPDAEKLKRCYVACTGREDLPLYQVVEQMASRAKELGWGYFELPTGHNPNESMPGETALLLDRVAKDC